MEGRKDHLLVGLMEALKNGGQDRFKAGAVARSIAHRGRAVVQDVAHQEQPAFRPQQSC